MQQDRKDEILYKGKWYPCRIVDVPDAASVVVSVESLEAALFGPSGEMDKEAEAIDNTIFFYVDDPDIWLPDEELAAIVAKCL